MTRNYPKHASLRDQFLAVCRRNGLALFWWNIRDLWLIGAPGTDCAANMWHAPDALLICNEHKAVPVREAVRCFEVVGIALDEVRLCAGSETAPGCNRRRRKPRSRASRAPR